MYKEIKVISILIGAVLVILLTLYFLVFNGKLSNISQDWSAFGNYISGVMMPVLTGINIWVFIRLTNEISIRDGNRQQREIEHQKRLLIAKVRQSEITRLAHSFDIIGTTQNYEKLCDDLMYCLSVMDSFANQKQSLFPIVDNQTAFQSLINLHRATNDILKKYKNGTPVEGFKDLLDFKHKAISELQRYIIDNLSE